jgi:hypothetical protein
VVKIQLDIIISEISICNSLSLVAAFEEFSRQKKTRLEKSPQVELMFEATTEKLIHFIMTKGMQEFVLRVADSMPRHS